MSRGGEPLRGPFAERRRLHVDTPDTAMTRSNGRKTVCGLLAVVVILASACACATRPSAGARLAREARMRPEARREQLHALLRKYPQPHDVYIHIMPLADETTVPLLLERFRIDHPMARPPEPPPDPEWIDPSPYSIGRIGPAGTNRTIQGFACVQGHLVEALAYATNTNRGMYYPAWQAWWAENGHKSRHEWIAQGFKEAGLAPADPVDEPFALDLIGLLPESHGHLAVNARRLLQTATAADRAEWIQKAARSEQRHRRLGAVSALRQLRPAAHEELLRRLTADPDVEIRQAARKALDKRTR